MGRCSGNEGRSRGFQTRFVLVAMAATLGVLVQCQESLAVMGFSAPAALNTNATTDSYSDHHPRLTTDGAGTWVAVWESIDNLGGTIGTDQGILVAQSTDNGVTWTAPAALNTNAATDSGGDGSCNVATDGSGNWVAVWHSEDTLGGTIGTDVDIVTAHSADNAVSWGAPAALNTSAASDSGFDFEPEVTTDGAGNWVVVWDCWDDLGGTIGWDSDILVSRSTDNGATWTPVAPLNTNATTDSGDDRWANLATDGSGNWVAVWRSNDSLGGTIGEDSDILVSRSTDNGATWTAPAALDTNAATDSGVDTSPKLATDRWGNWVAVWTSRGSLGGTIGTDDDILVARSTDNGVTWTTPAALNTNAATDSGADFSPDVTTDGASNWVIVWVSNDDFCGTIGTDGDILVSRSTDNGLTWTAPAPLNSNAATDSGDDDWADLATDGSANWVAVWRSNDSLGGSIGTDWDILVATAFMSPDEVPVSGLAGLGLAAGVAAVTGTLALRRRRCSSGE